MPISLLRGRTAKSSDANGRDTLRRGRDPRIPALEALEPERLPRRRGRLVSNETLPLEGSLRSHVRSREREIVIGNHVRVKVVKNKVAPPFKQAEFDVMFDEGISHASLVVDIAAEAGIIQKSGAWYSYGDQRIGQGRENAKLFLKDNPTLMAEVEQKVKDSLGVKGVVTAGVGAEEDE